MTASGNQPIFGRLVTAMVTPFTAAGDLDVAKAGQLAKRLIEEQCNDALVLNGTTGEAPTTSEAEKAELIAAVRAAIGTSAHLIAGVGTFDTAQSVRLAKQAADAGADGLLIVTPYYSLPPQNALIKHFETVADATELPCILYDIPHRTGRPIEPETMRVLAEHPNIVAVKDAKKNVSASAHIISETDLQYYAGDDAMVLPLLAIGACGLVGTSTHFTGRRTKSLIEEFVSGHLGSALEIYQHLLPVYTGVFANQGCMMVKAGLGHLGFDVGVCRPPMCVPDADQCKEFFHLLDTIDLS